MGLPSRQDGIENRDKVYYILPFLNKNKCCFLLGKVFLT